MAIPKPKVISNDPKDLSPVLLFGNLSQTNYYQVNFTGFGGSEQTGGLSKLSSYLKRFPSEDNGVDLKFITEGVGFLCSEATLPGSSLATAEVKDNFMGIQQEFAHTRLYTDIDFTFYVDTNYNTLKFFEGWIDFISSASEMDSITNSDQGEGSLGIGRLNSYYYRRMMWPDDYKCNTMSITKFEKDYGRSIHYLFINAFPKLVTAVPVSYGAADILRVSVSFNYDRYIINPPTGQFETNKMHEFNISRKDSSELRSLDISKSNSLNQTSDTSRIPTSEFANTGDGKDGTFGSGTHGKAMTSNPPIYSRESTYNILLKRHSGDAGKAREEYYTYFPDERPGTSGAPDAGWGVQLD